MPNPAQLELLDSFIGEKGIYITTILENNKLSVKTKIDYLKKAIAENKNTFDESLKKLNTDKETIEAYKVINNLYFNNEVEYIYGEPYETIVKKPALDFCFGALGKVELEDFQPAIRSRIQEVINILEHTYYKEFPQDFWKNKIKEEFMLEDENFAILKIESRHPGKIDKAKYWHDIYQKIEKKVYDEGIPNELIAVAKAVAKNDKEMLKALKFSTTIFHIRHKNFSLPPIHIKGGDLIDLAVHKNNQDALDVLFNKIIDNSFTPTTGGTDLLFFVGNSLLHQAIAFRQLSVVKELIEKGKNLNAKNDFLVAPLYVACRYGHLEIAKLLIANDADVNSFNTPTSVSPLQIALDRKNFELAEILIKHGARPVSQKNKSLLYDYCLSDKDESIVKFLLLHTDSKQYINKIETEGLGFFGGMSPFHLACSLGSLALVKLFLKHGANVEHRTSQERSALQLAEERNHLEVRDYLLSIQTKNTPPVPAIMNK